LWRSCGAVFRGIQGGLRQTLRHYYMAQIDLVGQNIGSNWRDFINSLATSEQLSEHET
jgi:hypothetical protein